MIDVKLIRIVTGEEIVAELLEETDSSIEVQNGLVVLPNANGVGFAPWATVIDKDNPKIQLSKNHIVYMVDVDSSVRTKYNEIFGSKLITPDSPKLIV
jgi:hypothetical protein